MINYMAESSVITCIKINEKWEETENSKIVISKSLYLTYNINL